MKNLQDLIDTIDPAWPLIQQWIAESPLPIKVLDSNRIRGEQTLIELQVTTHSCLGAVAWETGGILFDNGWLRFLGSGGKNQLSDLLYWNTLGDGDKPTVSKAIIIAHDALGGFFTLNGGAFTGDPGEVFYFGPDTLRWEGLGLSYSELLNWAASGKSRDFYAKLHWSTWEQDVAALTIDQGLSMYPFLWTSPDLSAEQRSRHIVPMEELWYLQQDLAHQIRNLPNGTKVEVKIVEANSDNA